MTMFSLRFCSLMAVLLAVVPATAATKAPGATVAAPAGASCPSKQQSETTSAAPSLFGVSQKLPPFLSMRGGQVFEPESLEEVDAILLKAGSEQKLVVIDFGATWCVA
jgi:hypothetical protein